MFKSSFAQDLLHETRQHKHLQDEILPKEMNSSVYKSQFAASTHGPLDNVSVVMEDDNVMTRSRSKLGPSPSIDNMNESSDQAKSLLILRGSTDIGAH